MKGIVMTEHEALGDLLCCIETSAAEEHSQWQPGLMTQVCRVMIKTGQFTEAKKEWERVEAIQVHD